MARRTAPHRPLRVVCLRDVPVTDRTPHFALQLLPAFALPTFRRVCGAPGTYTAILTGRHADVRGAMVEILRDAGMFPDELVLKPSAGAPCANAGTWWLPWRSHWSRWCSWCSGPTPAYKAAAVQALVEQAGAHGDVVAVNVSAAT